jgi:hypothetical protein
MVKYQQLQVSMFCVISLTTHSTEYIQQMWGWEIMNQVKGRFCKKVLRIPTSAANRAEGMLGIRSRSGIISSATVR